MFLAMTEEVRVIIVKLADRLHNMRTLSHMPPHKQTSIAMETLQVFAPLEKLLGMNQIKSELENLSFMYTNAEDHAKVKRRVEDLFKEHEKKLLEANKILLKKIQDDQFFDALVLACPGLHKGYGRRWLRMSYGCYLAVWQPHVHISLPLCLAEFADSLESCRKGASVIRMLQSYLGAECFQFSTCLGEPKYNFIMAIDEINNAPIIEKLEISFSGRR